MVTALHKNHGVAEGIHQIHNWNFANESARLSHVYISTDIGKVARQADTGTFWLVIEYSPVDFVQVGGSGDLDGYAHETLLQMIHLAYGGPFEGFSGAYREILPEADPFPTNIIWWTDSSKTNKIIEKIIVRDGSQMPIVITYNVYDTDGITIQASAIDNITYSGVFETNRERTIL